MGKFRTFMDKHDYCIRQAIQAHQKHDTNMKIFWFHAAEGFKKKALELDWYQDYYCPDESDIAVR